MILCKNSFSINRYVFLLYKPNSLFSEFYLKFSLFSFYLLIYEKSYFPTIGPLANSKETKYSIEMFFSSAINYKVAKLFSLIKPARSKISS